MQCNNSFMRSDPRKKKRPSATVRTINVTEVGTTPEGSNMCTSHHSLSTAVRKSHKDKSLKNQLLEPEAKSQSNSLIEPSSTSLFAPRGGRLLVLHLPLHPPTEPVSRAPPPSSPPTEAGFSCSTSLFTPHGAGFSCSTSLFAPRGAGFSCRGVF